MSTTHLVLALDPPCNRSGVLNPYGAPPQRAEVDQRKMPISSFFFSGPGWNRTNDLGIKSPLLYQLSYRPWVE